MPTVPDMKFESILSRERSLAKTVALEVIKSNRITVWEVTIPFIFILNYMRFKRSRETFTQNFLFTKKLALEAALDMLKKGQSKKEVMSRIEDKTSSILASDKNGIYSENIRRMQLKEIDLLIEHYCKLFEAEGKDHTSLVINAYQSQKNYTAFLKQLKRAQKEVNRAARQTVRTQTSSEIVSRIEKSTDRVMMAEATKIFGTIS